MGGQTGWDSDDAFVPDPASIPKVDYNAHPNHPLNGVQQEVLDIARAILRQAVYVKDVDPEQADPIADAVVAELRERGWIRDAPDDASPGGESEAMQLTYMMDGKVRVWLKEGMPAPAVAALLREIADGLESDPRRIG